MLLTHWCAPRLDQELEAALLGAICRVLEQTGLLELHLEGPRRGGGLATAAAVAEGRQGLVPVRRVCGTVQADISEPVGAPAAHGRALPRLVGGRSTRSEDGREGGAGESRTDAHGVLVVLMCRQSSRGRPISSAVSKSTPKSTSSARLGRGVPSGSCSWRSAGQHELLTPVSARALIGAKQPRGATRPSSGAEFWI